MSRELRNAQIIIGTHDLSKADGMMELPDGRVVGAIDLSGRHVTKVSITTESMVAERAELAAKWHAEEIERRILAGENHFTMTAPEGSHVGVYVYNVPRWHREPIRRLRVEWARWKARR